MKNLKKLSRESLKSVKGGQGTCAAVTYVTMPNGSVRKLIAVNASMAEAQSHAGEGNNGHWCCDSCDSASWL